MRLRWPALAGVFPLSPNAGAAFWRRRPRSSGWFGFKLSEVFVDPVERDDKMEYWMACGGQLSMKRPMFHVKPAVSIAERWLGR